VIEQSPEPCWEKGRALSPFPAAAEVPSTRGTRSRSKCIPRNANPETHSTRGDGQDRSMGGLGGGSREPDLRRSEAGATPAKLRQAIADGTPTESSGKLCAQTRGCRLHSRREVHSLRRWWFFEVQQNSDVPFVFLMETTFDAKNRPAPPLQIDEAIACNRYAKGHPPGDGGGGRPTNPARAALSWSGIFEVKRVSGKIAIDRGRYGKTPRVLVGLAGMTPDRYAGTPYSSGKCDVLLLPPWSEHVLATHRVA